ncbi:Calcineurin-like phosphoesterase [Rubritalea squalenifaciens DSM 18772]|uniref:Calcineurin-like phosphoesterase n=1 Tax=Rubritalea squalenifaciens DSM 18772 TaxID=1123071 RepID=A0A1M6E7C1_9BACT|nr:metallophosphoesterase [Rubritalea squalenifaciens]SHI81250.1 Calcineurin-like phosphoesterase [Rubritalea squalenifaciens DSM 18772]
MERRHFIQLSALGSVLGSSLAVNAKDAEKAEKQAQTLAVGHPAVMAPREDGVEIVWRVSGLAKGYVEYGKTKDLGQVQRGDDWGIRPAGKEVIRVRLEGCEPGTEYYYRVITENFNHKEPKKEEGEIRRFRTLDGSKDSTNFAVWNDTHKWDETIAKLQEMTPAGDFLLWNGDTSNDWYKEGEVAATLITPGKGEDFTAKHPLVFLRGNHDLRGTHAYQVEDYAATAEGLPWCAFRSGPVAAICLDTGEDKDDDNPYLFGRVACEPMRQAQAEWLEKVIQRPEIKNAPYKVVFCHIPLRWIDESTDHGYDHFSRRSRELWNDILVKWGVQIVVSGHTHREAHIKADEKFPYDQLVGGGPRMKQARLITAGANKERLQFVVKDMDGKVTQEVSLKPLV